MKNRKILSWALYDWANSAFSTTIMAGFFPVFLKSYWGRGVDAVTTTTMLGHTLSISGFAIAILSPFLGVVADKKGFKKLFLFVFMILSVLTCFGLASLNLGDWHSALWLYGIGYLAFNASCVFYDSLLPSISRGTQMDYASSLGYSLGYLGGGILFLINVIWSLYPDVFGFAGVEQAVKASFVSVGVWWIIFSVPLLKNVPEPETPRENQGLWRLMGSSFRSLKKTFLDLIKQRNVLIFLISYWLYIDGVYTVMTMAVDFGMAIGLESKHLIMALLLTQFVGFPFAWLFGLISPRFGCRVPILVGICIYGITVVLAAFMSQAWHFFALALVIGMVQGGVQSLSRSLFGNMIPEHKSGEYFAFFNLVGKFASILGPLLVAVVVFLTKEPRFGMWGLLILFISGGVLLSQVKEPA